jgi:transcriptional regulator with XRE-family HTH domain
MRWCIITVKRRYAHRHLPLGTPPGQNMHMAKKRHYIREWRKKMGLTQVQLSERAEVTQAMISRVEKGEPYNEEFIERIAMAMNLTIADLTMRDPSDPDGLWSIYDQLSPQQRVQLVETGKVILKTGTGG